MNKFVLFLFLSLPVMLFSQFHKHALFLGNSYTAVNELPTLTSQLAASAGDTLDVDYNYPGGTSLLFHTTDVTSQSKIAEGGWDFVVLQEQSQLPAFPDEIVEENCYPNAALLNEQILEHNPCAETMFYMTWGRKNGDPDNCDFWPPMCTYEGMDDLLRERYMHMAQVNDAVVAPVGAVRRFIRENYPEIELYDADGSHPSMAGTYTAAVCFYASMFRKNPDLISYNYAIEDAHETIIKSVVRDMVFNALNDWYITSYDPIASLEIIPLEGSTFSISNTSLNADEILLYNSATNSTEELNSETIQFTFPGIGTYTLCVHARRCDQENVVCYQIVDGVLAIESVEDSHFLVYPNPTDDRLQIGVTNWHDHFQVRMFDAQGKLVEDATLKNSQMLDVSGFNPGLYILEITYGKNRTSFNWMKR